MIIEIVIFIIMIIIVIINTITIFIIGELEQLTSQSANSYYQTTSLPVDPDNQSTHSTS